MGDDAASGRGQATRRLSLELVEKMIYDYEQRGLSLREISIKRHVAYGTARNALVRAGVKLRPRGGAH